MFDPGPNDAWDDGCVDLRGKLRASDALAGDEFGVPVSISGDTIAVGVLFAGHSGLIRAGSAYIFIRPATGWQDLTETYKLTASDAEARDRFGNAVATNGDQVLVGAYRDDDACPSDANCNSGSAYVFGVECEPEDSDGDGVPDDVDNCPDSDLSPTIMIDACDTGVANELFDDSCTMADLIMLCVEDAANHGQFVSCVVHLANEWKREGLITGREKGRIQRCAAQADVP